jgi:hypothetical protein
MKKRALLALLALMTAASLSVAGLQNSSAIELTPEQTGLIKSNCTAIIGSLNQLHASDALLRVNRGQIYETLGTKIMNSFNNRLSNNSLDNKGLVAVTTSYQKALDTFRTDYQAYEQQLSATLRIDCFNEPGKFHEAIADARTKRALVRTDVVRLNQYIERVTGKNS